MVKPDYKIEKLSSSNYAIWKIIITSHLMAEDLWDAIELIPSADGKMEEEEKIENEKAKHLIYCSMEPHQIAATGVCKTARELWIKIKENHEGAISNLQSTSLSEFLSIKYRKNESIISYAGRYEISLGRLESTGQVVDEKTKLWVFANTLPQHMRTTVQMFTMAKPEGKVSELISQLKVQFHLDNSDTDRQGAAYHTQEQHQSSERKPYSKPISSITCNYCKRQGHMWKECRKLKSDNERKKKYGQANRQRQQGNYSNQSRRPDHRQYPQRSNQSAPAQTQIKTASAFSIRKHTFSEGKFTWIIDSGASSHITPYKEFLADYEEFMEPHRIYLGNNEPLEAYGKGNMPFTNGEFEGELVNVLWVPEISENLFSTGRAMEQNCSVQFSNEKFEALFYRNNELVLRGTKTPDSAYFLLYLKPRHLTGKENASETALLGASYEEWHRRLGHCSMDGVKALLQSNAVSGLTIANNDKHECRACVMGKLCRAHHPERSHIQASETAAVLHMDTVDMKTNSVGGSRYFLLAVEEYSGYKLFETLSSKALIPDAVKRLINQAELTSRRPVKELLTDNGTEFTNHDLGRWLSKRGIIHSFSTTYTPQQNGRAERANRTVLDGIRTILNDSNLPDELWGEALNTIVYTTNRLLASKSKTKTRYELFTGEKPDISNLRVFGQKAIVRESDNTREGKLAPRGEEVTFVGYTDRRNTYRFFIDKPVQQIIISCDVRFVNQSATEDHQPQPDSYMVELDYGKRSPPKESERDSHNNNDQESDEHQSMDVQVEHSVEDDAQVDAQVNDETEESYHSEAEEPTITAANPHDSDSSDDTETDNTMDYHTSKEDDDASSNGDSSDELEVSACGRYIYLDRELPPKERPVTRSVTRSQHNKRDSTQTGTRESAMFTLDNEPRTVKDAQESKEWDLWRQAMDEEIHALAKNKTWILVDKPHNVKPIKNKWVFKAKLKPDGSIDRFKARLVAKGFTQIANVDYKETYAPVASMTTVRMFLAVANQNAMHIVQFDVKTAFLYGDLEEELYMEQPEFYQKDPNKVCKLIKSLYGLKQAPRQWNRKFDSFLKYFKLEQSNVDKCLYYNQDRSMLLAIYVDDGLAAGKDKKELNKLISYLKENFELKVMDCEAYLGFEIKRDFKERTLSVTQTQYTDKVINRFGMSDCKPVSTPEEVGAKFDESPPLPVDNQFKELVGSLLYLTTCTRPDIAHAVSIASRTAQPTQAHWVALKRILRYLKGTRDLGLRFRWENPNRLIGYSDADYANDVETRKSTTGYCIYFGGAPIAWRCQRQPIITLSTTEAEYVAGCELVKEILPIRQQLIELGQISEQEPTTIFIDNQSTVRIASNEAGQNRTKHIDIREKWLTEQTAKKKITVEHISGDEQAADILTKPLYKTKFIKNRSKLLTQIMSVLAIITLVMVSVDSRTLKLTDPLTPVKSDKVLIKGDIRYKLTNIFVNPCDHLFNYSTTTLGTEYLIRYCYEYFDKKHMEPLTNCRRLPTVGPDLRKIPTNYNCLDGTRNDSHVGKCEISQKRSSSSKITELEIESLQEAWNKYKKAIDKLPTLENFPILKREKRIAPLLVLGGIVLLGIMAGPSIATYELSRVNRDNIAKVANVTEVHTRALRESAEFFDQYRNSVNAIQVWSDDVEERLGNDPILSRLNADPIYRGKKANLVKSYMEWFDGQEKLLNDINGAASHRRIPLSLKNMLNGTSDFSKVVDLSTLMDCTYRMEDKNMILDMDFLLPMIDEDVEILKVIPTDVYFINNITYGNETTQETCWETYKGSTYMIHNKTNTCMRSLKDNKVGLMALRGQTCLEPVDELNKPTNRGEVWNQEACTKEVPKILDRVQITEIDGFHKIYCYPFNIEFSDEKQSCPTSPFILEGHAEYKIDNITHLGGLINTVVTRHMRSTDSIHKRQKRSPMPPFTSVSVTVTPAPPSNVTTPNPPKIGETLKGLTEQMNGTLARFKESLKMLPDKLNITKANFDILIDAPFEVLGQGFAKVIGYMKSLGSTIGILSVVMVIVLIMPAIELAIVVLKIARIPANMWLASARRVTANISESTERLPRMFRGRRKRRWEDTTKVV